MTQNGTIKKIVCDQRGGILLGQLVMASILMGIAVLMLGGILNLFTKTSVSFKAKSQAETSMEQLYTQMITTGRLAQNCARQVDGATSHVSLKCDVAFGNDRNNLTSIRFRIDPVGKKVFYEQFDSLAVPPVWNIRYEYANVGNVVLCDETMMRAGTCLVEPLAMNQMYKVKVENPITGAPAPVTDRFFRFCFAGPIVEGIRPRQLYGAFFVRNPSRSYGPLYYAWGTKDQN